MQVFRMLFFILILFSVCLPKTWGLTSQGESEQVERIKWVQNALDNGTKSSQFWQYGWTGIYGASAAYEGYNATEKNQPDEKNDKFDSIVNGTTSLLGFGSMVLDPLIADTAAEKLRKMPESTTVEIQEKLSAAEKLLRACAEREEKGRSWQTHLLAGVVSLLAGVAVACDDSREDDGLAMFASSMVVSEIQIFTMPTNAIDDLAKYKNQTYTTLRKRKPKKLFVRTIPGGLTFKYMF